MIETHLWEYLVAIERFGTLSAAGEHLHLTQPALSRSMKRLEELLGVTLFERGKNKIRLNDTGKMAAEQAGRLLEFENDVVEKVRTYDRSQHSLKISSCAPVPLRAMLPHFMERYPNLTITSEIKEEAALLRQLQTAESQIIVLTHPIDAPDFFSMELMQERMYFAVTKHNPLSGRKSVTFRDIDGQTILLYSGIGLWYETCKTMIPNSRLLLQNDFAVFQELADASEFPFFISNWHIEKSLAPKDRSYLPITDQEASVTYYCVCKKESRNLLKRL